MQTSPSQQGLLQVSPQPLQADPASVPGPASTCWQLGTPDITGAGAKAGKKLQPLVTVVTPSQPQ